MSRAPRDQSVYTSPIMRKLASASPDLPPSLRKVADFILRHPLKAATLTIEELAQETGTSPAAVNRLARALKLSGFSTLRSTLVGNLQDLVSPVDKLRQEMAQRPDGGFGLHEQLKAAEGNLSATVSGNAPAAFESFVDALCQARRIHVLGFGNSAYMAGLAAANLMPYCPDVIAISMEGGNENAAYRLAAIRKEDVLLAISLPRYSLDTIQLARFASERGARVLSITDSPASPLVPLSEQVLFAPADHPVLISSNAALLAVIEALVAAVMTRNKEAVRLAAELTESVMSYLHLPRERAAGKGRQRKD